MFEIFEKYKLIKLRLNNLSDLWSKIYNQKIYFAKFSFVKKYVFQIFSNYVDENKDRVVTTC